MIDSLNLLINNKTYWLKFFSPLLCLSMVIGIWPESIITIINNNYIALAQVFQVSRPVFII